jgi:hypothetical protein
MLDRTHEELAHHRDPDRGQEEDYDGAPYAPGGGIARGFLGRVWCVRPIEMFMRTQGKDETEQIGEEQHRSNVKTQLTLVSYLLPYHDLVKERWHEEPNSTEREQGRTDPSRSTVKCLAFVAQSATQGTEPQNEENVANN